MIAVAAASGAMAVALPAHADSAAQGTAADSPGLISGNTVQLPVHVPVNVCGNTLNVVGLLNPAAGNTCANRGAVHRGGPSHRVPSGGGAFTGPSHREVSRGGAFAHSRATDSPGLLSGNELQLPVDLPVNVSGNSVSVAGVGNAATGNTSTNGWGDRPHHHAPRPAAPPEAHTSTPVPLPRPRPVPQQPVAALAHTGADATVPALAGSAALVLGGAILYRRSRVGSTR
ncbi:MAG: chaplin [Streptomyces sp.]|nr:chaplin [Streptomyces sp.]